MKRSALFAAAGLVAGAILGGTVVATAAIPNSATGVIQSCVASSGSMRIVDSQAGRYCNANEQSVRWMQWPAVLDFYFSADPGTGPGIPLDGQWHDLPGSSKTITLPTGVPTKLVFEGSVMAGWSFYCGPGLTTECAGNASGLGPVTVRVLVNGAQAGSATSSANASLSDVQAASSANIITFKAQVLTPSVTNSDGSPATSVPGCAYLSGDHYEFACKAAVAPHLHWSVTTYKA